MIKKKKTDKKHLYKLGYIKLINIYTKIMDQCLPLQFIIQNQVLLYQFINAFSNKLNFSIVKILGKFNQVYNANFLYSNIVDGSKKIIFKFHVRWCEQTRKKIKGIRNRHNDLNLNLMIMIIFSI